MLKDKTAVVTGGGSGIGRATALKLAQNGANIEIIHMDPEEKASLCDYSIENGADLSLEDFKKKISSVIDEIERKV